MSDKLFKEYYKTKDMSLRNKIVEKNMGLVYNYMHSKNYHPDSYPDLVQELSIGLIKAVEKFDPYKNFKFSTFAYSFFCEGLRLFLKPKISSFSVKSYNEMYANKIRLISNQYYEEHQQDIPEEELIKRLEISREKYYVLKNAFQSVTSLHLIKNDTLKSPVYLMDLIKDSSLTEDKSIFYMVYEDSFDKLSDLEQQIFNAYIYEPNNQMELAEKFNLSQKTISVHLKEAIDYMKFNLEEVVV